MRSRACAGLPTVPQSPTATPAIVHHAARHIRADVYNKGLCGACAANQRPAGSSRDAKSGFCDAGSRRQHARRGLGRGFRAAGPCLVGETAKSIGPEAHHFHHSLSHLRGLPVTPDRLTEINGAFREVLRRVHTSSRDPNLHLIEGDKILTSFTGLSADLIHPSPDGQSTDGPQPGFVAAAHRDWREEAMNGFPRRVGLMGCGAVCRLWSHSCYSEYPRSCASCDIRTPMLER